jgi:hypothetical protein
MFSEDDTPGPSCAGQRDQGVSTNRDWACSNCGCPFPRPIAVSIKEFCRLVGCGKTTAWSLDRECKIETRKVRGRKVVLTRSIDTLLDLSSRGHGQ